MKNGATRVQQQAEEIPESTQKVFAEATLAILGNVKHFCALAVMTENKRALLTLGQAATEIINAAMDRIENPKKTMEN